MKIKINPYLRQLIKQNIIYIFSFFVLIVFFILILIFGIKKINQTNKNINMLNNDINNLQKKINLINTVVPNEEILNEDIRILNALIPNTEDYFSIIYALEILSQKTGFYINSYTVNVSQSTVNKLKLIVTGIGDANAFLKFLSEYNFGGSRLITSDKIELNQLLNGSVKLDLTFYNKKVDIKSKEIAITNLNIFKEIEKIKEKVSFNFINSENQETNIEYKIKQNPFN